MKIKKSIDRSAVKNALLDEGQDEEAPDTDSNLAEHDKDGSYDIYRHSILGGIDPMNDYFQFESLADYEAAVRELGELTQPERMTFTNMSIIIDDLVRESYPYTSPPVYASVVNSPSLHPLPYD